MTELRTRCVACQTNSLRRFYTHWECRSCGQTYQCVEGIPKLYLETRLGEADRKLRDDLYDHMRGRFYSFLWPFLNVPVRPVRISLIPWIVHFVALSWLAVLLWHTGEWLVVRRLNMMATMDVLMLALLMA